MKFTDPSILGLAAVALLPVLMMGADMRDEGEEAFEPRAGQAAAGAVLFAENCAKCHGADGQGTAKAPALVGDEALGRFATAQDVFDFASEAMPADRPGSLEDDEYWAILAFALVANGFELDEPLGPHNAREIDLHGCED